MRIHDVSFNRLAVKDYREAYDWYAERSPETAARFVEAVDAAVNRILVAPNSWSAVSAKYRRVSLDKFPHSLENALKMWMNCQMAGGSLGDYNPFCV
jgi:plasmid stabilization system protein ParE